MLYKMIDVSDPAGVDFARASSAGVKVCAGFIGGATPHIWTPEDWARPLNAGMWVMGIYVPAQDPAYYTASAGARDAVEWSAVQAPAPLDVIICDIEADMYDANPEGVNAYLQGWCSTVGMAGKAGVYGPLRAFMGWPARPRLAWVSAWQGDSGSWTGQWPTDLGSSPSLADIQGWQFAAGVDLGFGTVDLSVIEIPDSIIAPAAPAAPPEPTFTQSQVTNALARADAAFRSALGI